MLGQTLFQIITIAIGTYASMLCALLYFQRIRLERPAIGVFNFRDILVLLFFITALPLLYLALPDIVLTGFLILTFVSALYMGLRPLLPVRYLWPLIGFLIGANIIVAETLLGTRTGWQVYWVLTNIVVLLAVVSVSNLYVQGGMRLQHIAWFALFLSFYDAFFALVIPITQRLADSFEGRPLDPSIGFAMGPYNANVGIGDLLVFCLFIVAAYKGFGKKGVVSSLIITGIFGVLIPSCAPLIVAAFVRDGIGIVVPVQMFFGPVAFITYLWLSRRAPERSMAQWYKAQAASGRTLVGTSPRVRSIAERA
jgi:hypothetical protein